MFEAFREWRRERVLRHFSLPNEAWRATVSGLFLLRGLAEWELERLRQLATLFLHEKQVVAADGQPLDDALRLRIAAQACLPILNLGLDPGSGLWESFEPVLGQHGNT